LLPGRGAGYLFAGEATEMSHTGVCRPRKEDFAAAALVCQPFTIYLVIMGFLAPPTARNWQLADPILKLLPPTLTLWLVPGLAVLVAVLSRPDRDAMRRAVKHGALAAALGLICVSLLRAAIGPHLPPFIPSEENAGPGMLLSMTAGYAEEVIFRLMLLPLLFLVLFPGKTAPALLFTGLGFALLHAAGPEAFSWSYFGVRFMMPGVVMSLVALRISPAATVMFHSATHLLLPMLFQPGS
jgi:membrane protease YdiL (CAAX protease family)